MTGWDIDLMRRSSFLLLSASLLAAATLPAVAQQAPLSGNLVLYTSQPNTDAQQTIDAFKA